jgi:hypothetical protein
MPKEEKPIEKEKKEPSIADVRKSLKDDLGYLRDITNYVKQMTDNGCINPMLATDVKNQVEEQLRMILGLPAKQVAPAYTPPAPPQQQYQPPPNIPQYPPRPG